MTAPARTAVPLRRATFTEPARQVPLKWLTYELRFIAAIALLVLGFLIATLVAFATPADSDGSLREQAAEQLRRGALWAPIIGVMASAVVMPGRGDRRTLYGATAGVGAGLPFAIMILSPEPSKLVTVILFSLSAGFMVWAWMLLRDRPRLLQLLALGAVVLTLVVGGLVTELINGSGSLPVGWPFLFAVGGHIADAAELALARESITIWLAQAAVAVATVVGVSWIGRALAPRMRYITPQERDAQYSAKLAEKKAAFDAANPDAVPAPPTNTMALLAFIFGILGGWLAIVFGFIALSQIKRTGERGRGLAIAGLVIAFTWVIPVALFFILGFAGVWNR